MVRYKRYKKYGRRRSTNAIKMKFQSFMDISTSDSSMQIITVSVGGSEVLRRLAPQFGAYKYYKLGGISVKLVPASTLPVDPTGLSYEAGEPGVDPRDQLTPGMMRITNGEDVFENLTGLDDDQQHGIYNNMLLDPRWFKWMLQSGAKRFAKPRYWQIGQLHQDKWPGAFLNLPRVADGVATKTNQVIAHEAAGAVQGPEYTEAAGSSQYGIFQTGHRGVLGWMPTDGLQSIGSIANPQPFIASVPEVEVIKIILPKAYKTKYFYRMFITETVYFREPIVNFGIKYDGIDYRPLDVFHLPGAPIPALPSSKLDITFPTDDSTGGNYGDH